MDRSEVLNLLAGIGSLTYIEVEIILFEVDMKLMYFRESLINGKPKFLALTHV